MISVPFVVYLLKINFCEDSLAFLSGYETIRAVPLGLIPPAGGYKWGNQGRDPKKSRNLIAVLCCFCE